MPRDLAIETPGAAAAEPAAQKPADEAAVAFDPAATVAPGSPLQQALAQTAQLVGSPKALDWSGLTQAGAAAGDPAIMSDPDAGLPDQLDVDVEKITQPVKTRQGWVLPKNDPRVRTAGT